MFKKVLVIAPLRVCRSVWVTEPNKWRHINHLDVVDCTGSVRQRAAALMKPSQIFTINRENVTWLVDYLGDKWDFDAVFIDESSSFKNPSSKRFKSLKRILPKTEYMILLTGTPSPNGLLDMWAQSFLIDFGMSLGRTFTSYKQRFFESDYMGYKWTLREGADKKIHDLMRPYTLVLREEDYANLPPRIDLFEHVNIPAKSMLQYEQFEKDLFVEIGVNDEIEALNAATLAGKLLQWSNGAVYTDEHKNFTVTHTAKIDALKEIVEDNDEPMIVAYNFKSDLLRLRAAFPDAVPIGKDPLTIDAWNAGKIKMLLAHPASAGHGLNLQEGGALCVWFGLNWSLELYQQFNKRLHRQGQLQPVRIIHIVANNTIDTLVLSVLSEKDKVQSDLLTALRVRNENT
jgi:SNF2 family DNA or RNA helicase